MIKKTKLLFLSAMLIVAIPAQATEIKPKINQGDIEVGGSMNFNTYKPSGGSFRGFYFDNELSGQYFIKDKFSIGADLNFFRLGSRGLTTSVGPVFTRYFFVKDNVAPFFSLRPLSWTKSEAVRSFYSSSARLGVKFFLTDNIALAPAIDYKVNWMKGYEWHTLSYIGTIAVHF